MRFIITAQSSPDQDTAQPPSEFDVELFKAYMRFNEEMHQAGVLVASEGLNPAAPGARIAVAHGKRYVVDGPFAESRNWSVASTSLRSIHWTRRFTGRCVRRRAWGRTTSWKSANSRARVICRLIFSS